MSQIQQRRSWLQEGALKRQLGFFVLMTLTSAAVQLPAQDVSQSPSPAVMQALEAAFPQDLRYTVVPPSENPYSTCADVLSRNSDGTPNLIGAAFGGDGAKVVIFASTSSGTRVISDIARQQFLMTDGPCNLQLVNLADPEHPDTPLARAVDVTFSDGPDWFFTWDGNELQNITALQVEMGIWRGKKAPESAVYSANVVDIYHLGPMQIVGDAGGGDKFPGDDGIAATPTYTLFRYDGASFAPAKTPLALKEFGPNIPKTPEDLLSFNSSSLTLINRHQIGSYETFGQHASAEQFNTCASIHLQLKRFEAVDVPLDRTVTPAVGNRRFYGTEVLS